MIVTNFNKKIKWILFLWSISLNNFLIAKNNIDELVSKCYSIEFQQIIDSKKFGYSEFILHIKNSKRVRKLYLYLPVCKKLLYLKLALVSLRFLLYL